uniref:Uncharacterized protein n=1 Tax=Oryza meridionalis TaxID=40149 RepID=A0A0E0CFU9_9ORYZ
MQESVEEAKHSTVSTANPSKSVGNLLLLLLHGKWKGLMMFSALVDAGAGGQDTGPAARDPALQTPWKIAVCPVSGFLPLQSEAVPQTMLDMLLSMRLWRMMQGWIGIDFPLPTGNESGIADWSMKARLAFRTGYRSIFDSAFALTCWLLWKE